MTANLANISMERISRSALPFIIALIISLLIITYIPSLSLWPPDLLGLHQFLSTRISFCFILSFSI